MTDYVVVEVQIWLFLLIVLVLVAGTGVGLFYLIRYGRERDREIAREAAEDAAQDHLVRRSRMLIRLDHELKNPLTALRASGATIRELVRDPTVSAQEISASLDAMDSASRRVARLLADLRRLADIETRSIDFNRVDMDALVHQAVEDARTAPGAEGRTIVATVARAPWRLPAVAGEEDLLLSAVLNLLSNAVKYSGPTDVVELRANEQVINDHRWVVVEVADTGAGIPVSEQRAVFDELSRGQQVRSVAGSGMGLALVKTIIERHGGTVELYSQENVGTAVRIVLPALADSQTAGAPQFAPQAHPLQGADHGSRPVQPYQDVARFQPAQGWQQQVQASGPHGRPSGTQGVPPVSGERPASAPSGYHIGSQPGAAPHAPPGVQAPPGHQQGSQPSWQTPTEPRPKLSPAASQPTQPHPMAQAGLAPADSVLPDRPDREAEAHPGDRILGSPRRTSRRRFSEEDGERG